LATPVVRTVEDDVLFVDELDLLVVVALDEELVLDRETVLALDVLMGPEEVREEDEEEPLLEPVLDRDELEVETASVEDNNTGRGLRSPLGTSVDVVRAALVLDLDEPEVEETCSEDDEDVNKGILRSGVVEASLELASVEEAATLLKDTVGITGVPLMTEGTSTLLVEVIGVWSVSSKLVTEEVDERPRTPPTTPSCATGIATAEEDRSAIAKSAVSFEFTILTIYPYYLLYLYV